MIYCLYIVFVYLKIGAIYHNYVVRGYFVLKCAYINF